MNLVTVRTFDNYFLANIILTRLHAAGVECYLRDEYSVTLDPMLSNAIGGIKLVVKGNDEATTIQLLKQFDAEYMKSATCPGCGSNNSTYITKAGVANYLTAIFTWIFSSYAIAPEYVYQCGECGFECECLPETIIHEAFNQN